MTNLHLYNTVHCAAHFIFALKEPKVPKNSKGQGLETSDPNVLHVAAKEMATKGRIFEVKANTSENAIDWACPVIHRVDGKGSSANMLQLLERIGCSRSSSHDVVIVLK